MTKAYIVDDPISDKTHYEVIFNLVRIYQRPDAAAVEITVRKNGKEVAGFGRGDVGSNRPITVVIEED